MLIKVIRRKVLNDFFCRGLQNMASPIVEISHGQLRGTLFDNLEGNKFCAFLGIPYAKPPVGNLRFKVRYNKKHRRVAFSYRNFSANNYRGCVIFSIARANEE